MPPQFWIVTLETGEPVGDITSMPWVVPLTLLVRVWPLQFILTSDTETLMQASPACGAELTNAPTRSLVTLYSPEAEMLVPQKQMVPGAHIAVALTLVTVNRSKAAKTKE